MKTKQVLVWQKSLRNKSGQKLRTGKIAAQLAHASMKAIFDPAAPGIREANMGMNPRELPFFQNRINKIEDSDWGKNTIKEKLLSFFAESKVSEKEAKRKIESLSGCTLKGTDIQHGRDCSSKE